MSDNNDTNDDRFAEVFEQYRNDEMADPINHHPIVFGRTGTGKFRRLGKLLARHAHHRVDDTPSVSAEILDPKADPRDETTGGDA